jgi:hypothetical protein
MLQTLICRLLCSSSEVSIRLGLPSVSTSRRVEKSGCCQEAGPEQPFPGIEPTPPVPSMPNPSKTIASRGSPSASGELETPADERDVTNAPTPAPARIFNPAASRANQLSFPQISASGRTVSHNNSAKA